MALPPLGGVLSSIRAAYRQLQFRRQVDLTVEFDPQRVVSRTGSALSGTKTHTADFYVIRIANKSPTRTAVIRRVWFETTPRVTVVDAEFEVDPERSWKKDVRVSTVPGELEKVLLLARCRLSPDDKVIKSRPATA
jgi:hypothetical protein